MASAALPGVTLPPLDGAAHCRSISPPNLAAALRRLAPQNTAHAPLNIALARLRDACRYRCLALQRSTSPLPISASQR
jgi:hypothetical protein